MPAGFQRSRKAGSRLPDSVIYVGRPTIWGNPYPPGLFHFAVPMHIRHAAEIVIDALTPLTRTLTAVESVRCYAAYVKEYKNAFHLEKLRGRDLACWCKSGDPCHADVLLAIANAPTDLTLSITRADIVAATRRTDSVAYSPIYFAARRAGFTGVVVDDKQMDCDQGYYLLDDQGRKIQIAHALGIAQQPAQVTLTDIVYL